MQTIETKCQKRLEFETAAIQKQIPKKPINIERKIAMASCPVCCYDFPDMGGDDSPCGEVEKYDYCPNCGQRIDWSWEP